MKHIDAQILLSGDVQELKTSGINKENKHESHIPSSKTNSCVNLVRGNVKETQKDRACTRKNKFNWDKQMALPIHTKTKNEKLMPRKTAENENKVVSK